MPIPSARLPRRRQGLVMVLVVFLAACSGASSGPTSSEGSPATVAPSAVRASIVPATPMPTICASSCSVEMVDGAYLPRTLTIKVGAEVIWSNTSCDGCTVTFTGISLDSGSMATGATFKHTFTEAGSFEFHCLLQPDRMRGTIIVTG